MPGLDACGMDLLSHNFLVNRGTPEICQPVDTLFSVRPQMVALVIENLCLPGNARIVVDFTLGESAEPTEVVSRPWTLLQEWQDRPADVRSTLDRNETGGFVLNNSPWLSKVLDVVNPKGVRTTYDWMENNSLDLFPEDMNGTLHVNRLKVRDPTGFRPHGINYIPPELDNGERTPWIQAVEDNDQPSTLVISANTAATEGGAFITVNRVANGDLSFVTSIPISGAGPIGPFTIDITTPDWYYISLSGNFEDAVIEGGFRVYEVRGNVTASAHPYLHRPGTPRRGACS